jgi:alkylation response protein AidB-like acyl-CoA dehydrogenase
VEDGVRDRRVERYVLNKAAEYTKEWSVWDVPIATHRGISHPLAEAKMYLQLARLMTTRAANLYDAGLDARGGRGRSAL